ncbi:MAG: hypothetical protein U0805_20355 [Pirellulales bacterium]
MRTISAKIIDPTHLELSQPILGLPGNVIEISVPAEELNEDAVWHEAAKRHLLAAYADEDSIYDEL